MIGRYNCRNHTGRSTRTLTCATCWSSRTETCWRPESSFTTTPVRLNNGSHHIFVVDSCPAIRSMRLMHRRIHGSDQELVSSTRRSKGLGCAANSWPSTLRMQPDHGPRSQSAPTCAHARSTRDGRDRSPEGSRGVGSEPRPAQALSRKRNCALPPRHAGNLRDPGRDDCQPRCGRARG